MSSSLPVLPTPLEDKYPKLPDSFQIASERELMRDPVNQQSSPLGPNSGTIKHLLSSSSTFPNELNDSLVSPRGGQSQNSPFIYLSSRNRGTLPVARSHSSHPEELSIALINHSEEHKDMSWSMDPLHDLLDFPENVTVENGQVESNIGVITSEDLSKRTDWHEWADQLISVDDNLEPNWSDLLNDSNATDVKQKVLKLSSEIPVHQPQIHQHQHLNNGEPYTVANPTCTAPPEMGRPSASTKLGSKHINLVRTRGGNEKHRALRLDTGVFSWGSESQTRRVRILDVVYNASNMELVRTKTLVKNAIVQVDATAYRQFYEQHYGLALGKKKKDEAEAKRSRSVVKKVAARAKDKVLDSNFKDQFNSGRLYACIASRPGQSGRADGYLLEGDELSFYLKKLQKKK